MGASHDADGLPDPAQEFATLLQHLARAPSCASPVVGTAMRIMLSRYREDGVRGCVSVQRIREDIRRLTQVERGVYRAKQPARS